MHSNFLFPPSCKPELDPCFPVQIPSVRSSHHRAVRKVSASYFFQRSQGGLQGHVHSVADGFGMIWHGVTSALRKDSKEVTVLDSCS